MELITSLASECRVAAAYDKVMNAECVYTFHSPYTTDQGILVNLNTFVGTVQNLAFGSPSSDKGLFVRIVKKRVVKKGAADHPTNSSATTTAPTKLAIGVEGGFASEAEKYDTISSHSIVVLSKRENNEMAPEILAELPYTDATKNNFPTLVTMSVDSIVHHAGALTPQDAQQWKLDEEIPVSKYAAQLPFVDNDVRIVSNPKHWACQKYPDAERSKENLWLNLSDGFIGGGRKNWDGSGGTGGALDHYDETGKLFPLVVKLGTLTADIDTADCYSYAPDEDGPVRVPNLKELLVKRGIHIASMQKTVKSTAELEVELNANYAFDAITEAGAQLVPVSGPGLQGLQNLGNSCYMNSVLQVLLSGTVSELAHRYGTKAHGNVTSHAFLKSAPTSPWDNLLCQTTKIACALTSGAFALPVDQAESEDGATTNPKYRLAPRMFKHLIGKDHVDFCTAQQQDAAQFFQYLLEKLDQAELAAAKQQPGTFSAASNIINVTSRLFTFATRTRLVCMADQKIKYNENALENVWGLRIPMEKAVFMEEEKKAADIASPEHKRLKSEDSELKQVPTITFAACLEEWASESTIDDLKWAHLQSANYPATQRTRFANFPRYLVVQMHRYEMGPDWTPVKLEVKLDIPQELDLSQYRCSGPQDGEKLVPEDASVTAPASAFGPTIDESALSQLMDMGFSMNSCRRALIAVGGNNSEAAMNWIFEHNTDPDFNDPLPQVGGPTGELALSHDSVVDEGSVQTLVENLGCFPADHVRAALKATNGSMEQAADWLFSHMDDIDSAISALQIREAASDGTHTSSAPSMTLEDGDGKYSMIGMISHIGKNTGSGHYVAHLKRGDDWVIFNDEKVALSSKPPTEHAYMYLYKRSDAMNSPNLDY
ncbi:hypothetical protein MPSEU_000650800 [Mayamaea pseudoterrestris]|nr:hypothetical protein MPSEU_000650800 [Mayamaea pseudoterrestris]